MRGLSWVEPCYNKPFDPGQHLAVGGAGVTNRDTRPNDAHTNLKSRRLTALLSEYLREFPEVYRFCDGQSGPFAHAASPVGHEEILNGPGLAVLAARTALVFQDPQRR